MTQRKWIAAESAEEAMMLLRSRFNRNVHSSWESAERDAREACADGWPGTRVWVAEIRPAEED